MRSVFKVLLVASSLVGVKAQDEEDVVMRWSSTGGGWRSMFACIGYANAFQQAGLFRNGKSHFSAIVRVRRKTAGSVL